eukprot:Selendium_serpulae@DN6379_c0_g1_i1.p1
MMRSAAVREVVALMRPIGVSTSHSVLSTSSAFRPGQVQPITEQSISRWRAINLSPRPTRRHTPITGCSFRYNRDTPVSNRAIGSLRQTHYACLAVDGIAPPEDDGARGSAEAHTTTKVGAAGRRGRDAEPCPLTLTDNAATKLRAFGAAAGGPVALLIRVCLFTDSQRGVFTDSQAAEPLESHLFCQRFKVDAGGCSGFRYDFKLLTGLEAAAAEAAGDAQMFRLPSTSTEQSAARGEVETLVAYRPRPDVAIAIDPVSSTFLRNCVVDYVSELIASSFQVISNDSVSSVCSCGESFDVETEDDGEHSGSKK